MGGRSGPLASDLVGRVREQVAAGASRNRFVDLLEAGDVPRDRLTWLAGEQFRIVGSDQRSFALLAARFPDPPAGELFLSLAQGELQALRLLADFAAELGWGERELRAYEPRPLAQAYPAFLAWSALFGTCSGVALAMLANLEEWGGYCGRVAEARRADIRTRVCHGRRQHRAAQREPPARACLKLGDRHQPMLNGQGGRRGEPVLVIARRQVVARLHPLDRMPELPAARLDRASHHRQQRPGHRLPPTAKNRFRRRMLYRPQALHATQVMDTVHQQDPTPPCGGTERPDLRNRDRRAAALHNRAERRFSCSDATREWLRGATV